MRHLRFLFLLPLLAFSLAITAVPAGAQTLDEIANTIDRDGSYLELELQGVASDAVNRANGDGVGFVYLDQENASDLPILTDGLLQRLDALGSSYRTLIVLDASGVWVQSLDRDTAGAADAALPQFATGAVAGGIDTVLSVLGGGAAPAVASNDAANNDAATGSDGAAAADTAASSSGGGVPWLLIIFLGLAVFFAVRFFSGRKRKAAALEAELAEDRAEIREQLRNNSDHVIDLGDRIANADDDLRVMYEEAAQTFQDVSMGLEDAATALEIDALDDRLDRAEWQFEVIEARLDGRTPPTEPTIGEGPVGRPMGRQPVPPLGGGTRNTPPPPNVPPAPTGRSGRSLGDDRPALGDDESLFPGGGRSSQSRSGQSRSSRRQRAPRRRSGGGLGGMVGGMAKAGLLSMVLKMLLGGGLSLGSASRRTQQRRGPGGGGYSGGVGGGVLR